VTVVRGVLFDAEAAEQVARHERLGAGGAAVLVAQVHDRGDVERADVRVHARVAAQVDPLDRRARRRGERRRPRARLRGGFTQPALE